MRGELFGVVFCCGPCLRLFGCLAFSIGALRGQPLGLLFCCGACVRELCSVAFGLGALVCQMFGFLLSRGTGLRLFDCRTFAFGACFCRGHGAGFGLGTFLRLDAQFAFRLLALRGRSRLGAFCFCSLFCGFGGLGFSLCLLRREALCRDLLGNTLRRALHRKQIAVGAQVDFLYLLQKLGGGGFRIAARHDAVFCLHFGGFTRRCQTCSFGFGLRARLGRLGGFGFGGDACLCLFERGAFGVRAFFSEALGCVFRSGTCLGFLGRSALGLRAGVRSGRRVGFSFCTRLGVRTLRFVGLFAPGGGFV